MKVEYTLVLPVCFYRTTAGEFACESAFALHLLQLRDTLPSRFSALRVCGPRMSEQQFAGIAAHAGRINEHRDGIFLTELNPAEARARAFWMRHAIPTFRAIWRVVRHAGLVHSGPSMNVFQPNEIFALVAAHLQSRKTIAVVDIDIRNDSRRARTLGLIGKYRFLAECMLFDPLRNLQLKWVARYCSLVLFKGKALVDDLGGGRSAVKNFFDTAHALEHVISTSRLEKKHARLLVAEEPVRLVYFGRLVQRKGVDLCLRAVVEARTKFGANVSFTVVGDGPELPALKDLAKHLQASGYVSFLPPVQFGQELFDLLYGFDTLLAAPLTEDTPRSAFDAMAAGMSICAFDTEYYRTLEDLGPAVSTSPWMSIQAMSMAITGLASDRARLVESQQAARLLAIANTQDVWLKKRAAWTREYCGDD